MSIRFALGAIGSILLALAPSVSIMGTASADTPFAPDVGPATTTIPGLTIAPGAPTAGGNPCAPQVWPSMAGYGGKVWLNPDPTRPAILLVHGLGEDGNAWIQPSHLTPDAPGHLGTLALDYQHTPPDTRIGDTHDGPNAGVYKVGNSNLLYGANRDDWDCQNSWFGALAQKFTLYTWSQPGATFADAYPSATQALTNVFTETQARNPSAPPPVALVGHSRGGLLIRQLLKDQGTQGRIRWVITLHTPNAGSDLAAIPGQLNGDVNNFIDGTTIDQLPGSLKNDLKSLALDILSPITAIAAGPGYAELAPNSPLLTSLANGESALPDVSYYSFGGVNTNFFRLYVWLFDPMSAVPQYKQNDCFCAPTQYFVWNVKAAELPVSPVLGKYPAIAPEVHNGDGDGLVADARSHLPFAGDTHVTDHLNHVEVMWNKDLQNQVTQIIDAPPRIPVRLPACLQNGECGSLSNFTP